MGKNVSFSVRWDNDGYHHLNYLELFEKYLQKVKHSTGDNYTALCPFHDDHNPSFSFDATSGLWQCFACGEKGNAWQFADRMGDEEWKQKITRAKKKEQARIVEKWKEDADEKTHRELPPPPPKNPALIQVEKKVVNEITYVYHDRDGKELYKKVRYEYEDKTKKFSIDWISQEKKHVLYDLACLQYLAPSDIVEVWFCEGEKCREALLEATESRSDILIFSYSISPEQEIKNSTIEDYLIGRRIVVFADNDETGERKASQIISYAKKYANQIDVIRFSDRERGYDIADYLEEGHSIEEALLLANTEHVSKSIVITDVNAYASKQIEPVPILDELYQIPKGVLSVIAGMGSVGKGYFLLWNMLRWIENYAVAYLSAEDPIHVLEHRLQKLVRMRQKRISTDREYIVPIPQKKPLMFDPLDLQSPTLENLYDAILFYVEQGYEIIIVDPISAFLENEQNNSEVAKFMYHLQKLCVSKNVNIFLSHHVRKRQKNEQIRDKFDMMELVRGASALHSNARFVWFLRRNATRQSAIEVWNVKNSYLPNARDVLIDIFGDMKMTRIWMDGKGHIYMKDMVDFFVFENQKFSDDITIPIDAFQIDRKKENTQDKEGEDENDTEGDDYDILF